LFFVRAKGLRGDRRPLGRRIENGVIVFFVPLGDGCPIPPLQQSSMRSFRARAGEYADRVALDRYFDAVQDASDALDFSVFVDMVVSVVDKVDQRQ
jgi:hypothetical protein